jgi:hypothetical protein
MEFGDFTAFSPCATGANANIGPGFLIGELVNISVATKVTALGVIGNPGGGVGIMALYSNVSGLPSVMETESGQVGIGNGNNILQVTPVSLSAGSYWVMAEFSATSVICVDGATSNTIVYGNSTFGSVPQNFSAATGQTTLKNTVDLNFYVLAAD